MISFFVALALTSSPYPFEVEHGVATEIVTGTSFLDKADRNSANAGLRMTYLNSDETDAVMTAEVQFLSQTVFTGSNYKTPRYRFVGDTHLAFYEFYHPFAFRLVGGPSAEWRTSKLSWGLGYRAGLGYYLKASLSVFADFGQHYFWRSSGNTMPNDLSLSLQIIF